MNAEKAAQLFQRIEGDAYSANLFARANARYILFGVNEDRANFPATLESNLNNGSDALAFSYLSIGCTLAEENIFDVRTRTALEKGAEFIEYAHLPAVNRNSRSKYYLLVGALAYYASSQYSKAFILMKEATDYQTDLSVLVSSFLKKDFQEVSNVLNRILLEQQAYILNRENQDAENSYTYHVVIFAKAIANLLDYLFSGTTESLLACTDILKDLEELLLLDQEPALWWISRLFGIIAGGFASSSLWSTVSPLIPSGNTQLGRDFIANLLFGKKPVVELFTAQRAALPLLAAGHGAVISLPTSSGKTQIAAIGILKSLLDHPGSKVLYIAPYRSLAFEVEMTLKSSFDPLGYPVSQLYGSGQFGSMDTMIIEEASILIATPEKAKVILRSKADIAEEIKLVIIDEGHLLDDSQRNVRNELFVEELKVHVKKRQGIILLLSAVLPNTQDIATWVTDDQNATVTEKERLARQRLGILAFRNNAVSLEWLGDEKSFNYNFIRSIPPKRKNGRIQPTDRAHAVGMTALRLSEQNKSVLLFTSRARSVPTYAEAILAAMKLLYGALVPHQWTDAESWEELSLLCSEHRLRENDKLLEYASHGILCHYGNMHKDIKGALEKLMKNANPRIIVATMTLGQGVNLGVSTVILADTDFFDREKKKWIPISHNEVWNIVGRAGRAFQDIEGKILFASENNGQKRVAMDYIENPPKSVVSGLLQKIAWVKRVARNCNMDFATLLELIANNDFSNFERFTLKTGRKKVDKEFYEVFDWIDDTLLALDIFAQDTDQSLDDMIRSSLAYLQASSMDNITREEVFDFLKARTVAIENMVPAIGYKRTIVLSSLPLASAVALDQCFDEILEMGDNFLSSGQGTQQKIALLKSIEGIIETFPSYSFKPKLNEAGNRDYPNELLDEARALWISGSDLSGGSNVSKIIKICNHHYGFTISWVVGAIANKCRTLELDDLAQVFEELALSCELGLPDVVTAKIYLAGYKSRISSMDIAQTFTFDIYARHEFSIAEVRAFILNYSDQIRPETKQELSKKWLDFLGAQHRKNLRKVLPPFKDFILPDYPDLSTKKLIVRSIDGDTIYLTSPDYNESFSIQSSADWPFAAYANLMNYYFEVEGNEWKLVQQG